jgi:hypothetical protein
VEKDVMIASFAIRKLVDSRKLSEAVLSTRVHAQRYRRNGRVPHILSWLRIERSYDIQNPQDAQLTLTRFCNQIIHSYVFAPALSAEGGLAGILFVSDFDRRKALYAVELDVLIEVLNAVGNDEPDQAEATWDANREDFNIRLFKGPQ